ncbi:MAG TPA: WYL domain-containing protein [Longimicrobiales bacterium]|nr:WYL domain-containing protein [Longimicrobiales bacterium]
MADKITKLQRWLDLVAFLAARRFPIPMEDIWAGVPGYAEGLEGGGKDPESVRRMFNRDKDELAALGIPIETVTFHVQQGSEDSHGYRLASKNFHLPYLNLVRRAEEAGQEPAPRPTSSAAWFTVDEDEAGAALEGLHEVAALPGFPLRREARSAFRKLAFDLDPDVLHPPPVVYAEDPETAATAEILRELSRATLARKSATFRYRSMGRDDEGVRTVRPYGLLFQHGRWYLVAWAEDRGDVRMFRVGRMSELVVNARKAGTPDFDVPADFELQAYAGRKAWELGAGPDDPVQALVRFRFPRSLWAERNGHGILVDEDEDGSQLRSIAVHSPDPFLRWILSLEGDARVEGPPEVKAQFQAMVAAVARRYERTEGDPRG